MAFSVNQSIQDKSDEIFNTLLKPTLQSKQGMLMDAKEPMSELAAYHFFRPFYTLSIDGPAIKK